MPSRKVKVSYVKAGSSPGQRKRGEIHPAHLPPMKQPKGLSPLARYLEENRDSGLTTQELIEQFQEYDCTHAEKLHIVTGHKLITTCNDCGLVEVTSK